MHNERPAPQGFRKIENQSVVLFEIRENFRNPLEKLDIPIAKAKYVKTQKVWKIYW